MSLRQSQRQHRTVSDDLREILRPIQGMAVNEITRGIARTLVGNYINDNLPEGPRPSVDISIDNGEFVVRTDIGQAIPAPTPELRFEGFVAQEAAPLRPPAAFDEVEVAPMPTWDDSMAFREALAASNLCQETQLDSSWSAVATPTPEPTTLTMAEIEAAARILRDAEASRSVRFNEPPPLANGAVRLGDGGNLEYYRDGAWHSAEQGGMVYGTSSESVSGVSWTRSDQLPDRERADGYETNLRSPSRADNTRLTREFRDLQLAEINLEAPVRRDLVNNTRDAQLDMEDTYVATIDAFGETFVFTADAAYFVEASYIWLDASNNHAILGNRAPYLPLDEGRYRSSGYHIASDNRSTIDFTDEHEDVLEYVEAVGRVVVTDYPDSTRDEEDFDDDF